MNKTFCLYCLQDTKRSYPGNDPENGPAYVHCQNFECQFSEALDHDLWLKNRASIDQSHLEALGDEEERQLDLSYQEMMSFSPPLEGDQDKESKFPHDHLYFGHE